MYLYEYIYSTIRFYAFTKPLSVQSGYTTRYTNTKRDVLKQGVRHVNPRHFQYWPNTPKIS